VFKLTIKGQVMGGERLKGAVRSELFMYILFFIDDY